MKKIIFLLICIFATALTLASCGRKYEPVKSTKEESRVVFTMEIDGEEYDVKYELYRMLFLNNKALIDGGDNSVWSSDKKENYIRKMNALVYDRAAEIFSVFAFAEELGINPYSAAVEDKIYEYIVLSVEGNQADYVGHGSYDKFLASLKERNMNYSVMELLLRYSIVSSFIYEEYRGVTDDVLGELPGNITISKEDVSSYYFDDECARVLQLITSDGAKATEHKAAMEKLPGPKGVALYIINKTTAVHTDCIVDKEVSGTILGKYALDSIVYGEYSDAVFSLSPGQFSEVIEINDEGKKSYYVAFKLTKSPEHFERCYDAIKQSYIDNEVGRKIEGKKRQLISSVEVQDGYAEIIHASIYMN